VKAPEPSQPDTQVIASTRGLCTIPLSRLKVQQQRFLVNCTVQRCPLDTAHRLSCAFLLLYGGTVSWLALKSCYSCQSALKAIEHPTGYQISMPCHSRATKCYNPSQDQHVSPLRDLPHLAVLQVAASHASCFLHVTLWTRTVGFAR